MIIQYPLRRGSDHFSLVLSVRYAKISRFICLSGNKHPDKSHPCNIWFYKRPGRRAVKKESVAAASSSFMAAGARGGEMPSRGAGGGGTGGSS